MTTEQIIANILQTTPLFLFKAFAVMLLLLHLSFAFVLIRQTKMMTHVVEAQISPALYSISIIHFLSSFFVLVWTLIFL